MIARIALALTLIAGCSVERSVDVSFVRRRGVSNGFACRDTPSGDVPGPLPPFLAIRAASERRMALVVDFVDLGGTPSCRPTELGDWCAAHPCVPIAAARKCYELELTPDGSPELGPILAIDRAISGLAGEILTSDAPSDRTVIVRAIGTTQRCDDVDAEGFDRDSLVGCVYSCPVDLDRADGLVTLDLPSLGEFCEPEVATCALDFMFVDDFVPPDGPIPPPPSL